MGQILRINKLIIVGRTYKRSLVFDYTLNIIQGDGYSGKSLVLRLIDYCLGSNDTIDLSVQKELGEFCDEVFAEVSIGGRVFTFNRHLKTRFSEIRIYLSSFDAHKDYSPWKKNLGETNDYIANELGISLHSVLRKKPGSSDLIEENISFRDFMRFVYIKQGELGTNNFLDQRNVFVSRKNKEVFKIINDLIIPDIEQIETQIRFKQNEYNRIDKINSGLIEYLNNKNASNLFELENERGNIDKEIKNAQDKKNILISEKKSVETDMYRQLKTDISEIDTSLDKLYEHKSNLLLSIKNKEVLLDDYKSEISKMNATIEAMKKIKITEHENKCPLCNSMLEAENSPQESLEDVELVYEQLVKKIAGLEKVLETEQGKFKEIEEEIDKNKSRKSIFINAINEYRNNMQIPNLSEIESLNSLIRDLQNEKNKLNSLCDVHSDVNANGVTLERLSAEISKLQKQKNDLKKLTLNEENLFRELNEYYRLAMAQFKFGNTSLEETYISKEDYLPYYSGSNVTRHTSGCLLICMQIAYLGAILKLCDNELFNCYHPRLLMLDTVSNNIGTNNNGSDSLDPQTYEELYKYLIELAASNQLFIIDNTPPTINVKHKSFLFHRDGLKGLIDIEKNEYVSVDV